MNSPSIIPEVFAKGNSPEFPSRLQSGECIWIHFRDGPLENLLGAGGGRAKYKKKYSRKGKYLHAN